VIRQSVVMFPEVRHHEASLTGHKLTGSNFEMPIWHFKHRVLQQ
jgi:hypothetical protein